MDDAKEGYRLIDAGGGRRLERFGGRLVDRPAPAAGAPAADPAAWAAADLRYERWTGWHAIDGQLTPWPVTVAGLTMELRPTESGQVGLFPEQLDNLGWLAAQIRATIAERARLAERGAGRGPSGPADAAAAADAASPADLNTGPGRMEPPVILNLFASTGLVSLALAAAGAAVVHVDSLRPAVAWARQNAARSGMASHPIRWIVDDAEAFVARERRRGRRYDGIVLDPPSYGHGDRAKAWRIEERLAGLLAACAALLGEPRAFCLLTAHAEGLTPAWLAAQLSQASRRSIANVGSGGLVITADSGARLGLGAYARFSSRAQP